MTQSGVYSESKLVWWYAREQKLPDAPKQVQLILSDMCNQDCSFCAYRMSGYTSNELFVGDSELAKIGHNNPKRWIETGRAMDLIEEINELGCLSVQFTGGGEPTVHPDYKQIFVHALDSGLRCSLVSNGLRWDYDLIHTILPWFDWVRVSIDAATPDSYAKTRRVPKGHWNRVWTNVNVLARSLKNHKSRCAFGLGFVVTPDSYKEIVDFARLAKVSGVGNIRYTAMFSTENETPFIPIYDQCRTLIDEARKLQTDDFKVYDNFGSRFEDLKQHAPDYSFCSYQFFTAYIGGDLNVYRCCVTSYSERGKVAETNLKNIRFDDFWKSRVRKNDMTKFDARGCKICQFNKKNRDLLYVMGNTESDVVSRHLEWP